MASFNSHAPICQSQQRCDESDLIIRGAALRSSSFFDPIFAAHQSRNAKQDQAAEPDDGSQLHERSEAFGQAVPHLGCNSAEYPAKAPQPEQNKQNKAGDAECRAQPGIGCPRRHVFSLKHISLTHKTAVHGFVSTQNSTASINPHGLIREALHDVVQPATPAEMIVLFACMIAPALMLFTCAE